CAKLSTNCRSLKTSPSPSTSIHISCYNPKEAHAALSPALRQNRKYPRGKTGGVFRFGKTDHDQRAGFGNLIKIREQLNLTMVRAQDVSLERIIVFTRSEPGIGIGGFMA